MVLQKRGIVVKSLFALDILYGVIFPIIYSNSKKDLLNGILSENIYYICRNIFDYADSVILFSYDNY